MSARRRLIHYSSKPLTAARSVHKQPKIGSSILSTDKHALMGKPRGLWVSAEGRDDWRWWCEAEQWNLGGFRHATEVRLAPRARLLWVRGDAALQRFNERYGRRLNGLTRAFSYSLINWAAVAKSHQGVVIAPYVWERRLDTAFRWYYGWDCASGVIWDASAVAELVPLPLPMLRREEDAA